MARDLEKVLLPHLPAAKILAAYRAAPGQELDEKFSSPESSAALVANTFGFFLEWPELLPIVPGLAGVSWPPKSVSLEKCLRFPWRGGSYPWLDVLIETPEHIVGVESKRYEPFRGGHHAYFSLAYSRDVWGTEMGPYEDMRDKLTRSPQKFAHLDAAQLVKHAFAIRTQAMETKKRGVLAYLYAEPCRWPDNRPVAAAARKAHSREVGLFQQAVRGAEVGFAVCKYKELLAAMRLAPIIEVRRHASAVKSIYPDV